MRSHLPLPISALLLRVLANERTRPALRVDAAPHAPAPMGGRGLSGSQPIARGGGPARPAGLGVAMATGVAWPRGGRWRPAGAMGGGEAGRGAGVSPGLFLECPRGVPRYVPVTGARGAGAGPCPASPYTAAALRRVPSGRGLPRQVPPAAGVRCGQELQALPGVAWGRLPRKKRGGPGFPPVSP